MGKALRGRGQRSSQCLLSTPLRSEREHEYVPAMGKPTIHDFIRELEATGTHYALTCAREGALMVQVALPGERWEVEFFDGREPEVEVFISDGHIFSAAKLGELREKAEV